MLMGASICCAEAEAYTQLHHFRSTQAEKAMSYLSMSYLFFYLLSLKWKLYHISSFFTAPRNVLVTSK